MVRFVLRSFCFQIPTHHRRKSLVGGFVLFGFLLFCSRLVSMVHFCSGGVFGFPFGCGRLFRKLEIRHIWSIFSAIMTIRDCDCIGVERFSLITEKLYPMLFLSSLTPCYFFSSTPYRYTILAISYDIVELYSASSLIIPNL